jgi:nucleotide-binding universal stress UspA family protein
MTFRIAQDFAYAGNDYWRWRAWIEAGDAELDTVKEVTWILHPTFKRSRVTVDARASKFELSAAGWGTFLLRAEVRLKNGDSRMLKHQLRLEYPPDASTKQSTTRAAASKDAIGRPLTVFLSYSAQDNREAAKVREQLQKAGLDVVDQTRLSPGDVLADAVRDLIGRADAVVALVTDELSPWVRDELVAASSWDKPAFALLWPHASNAGLPTNVRLVQVDEGGPSSSQIVELLRTGT